MGKVHSKIYQPYVFMLCVYALFIAAAFFYNSPGDIAHGLLAIVFSSSVIITDYILVSCLGAALINSVLVGSFCVLLLVISGVKPNGSIIMALWVTTGFAFFGNNLFNMLPLIFGVYLYSRFQKEPFINFSLAALLSTTLSPVVSGIAFADVWIPETSYFSNFDIAFISHSELRIALGIVLGVLTGFIFPAVSSFTMRFHGGYDLYNMGFAGGIISTFLISLLSSVGINMKPNLEWSTGNNTEIFSLLCIIFAGLIICGLLAGGKETLTDYPDLMRTPGRLVSDYYLHHGARIYFNMGITGIIAASAILMLGCDLNGPTVGGIFTIVGFSAFGKHPRNILPLMIGAVIATKINLWDATAPANTLAILFSTGLAPIAGQFGWIWGIVAGFLHVNTILHISFLNSGFNLYNNGYAAGLVAILVVPLVSAFKTDKGEE